MHRTTESAQRAYAPFPNVPFRNALQATVEIGLLVRLLAIPEDSRILEIGCGRGVALGPLARLCRPRRLVGLDIDRELLHEAARRIEQHGIDATVLHGDARALPFPDASFDLVIDFGTCYHVARPERALAEVTRVLRDGGLFVHETRVSQMLAHPVRSFGRRLPWPAASRLMRRRHALLWATEEKFPGVRPAVP